MKAEIAGQGKEHSQRTCPLCGATGGAIWRIGRDRLLRITEMEFTYLQCKVCGVYFQAAPPPPTEIGQYYPTEYGPYLNTRKPAKSGGWVGKSLKKLLTPKPRALRDHLDALYQPPSAGLLLLDYGCGSDKFLNEASRKGWQTIGVDFAEKVLEKVEASGHRAYLANDQVWQEVADESISLIRMSHVIEHLYTPKEVLADLFRKLSRGGKLHIATPNPAGLGSQIFKSRWLGLDCPRHIVLFPPDVLTRMLKKTGFGKVEVLPEFVTKDFARSIGYYLTDAGLIKQEDVSGLMHNDLLSAALALPCFASATLGWPDRYHIIAQKC